MERGWRCLHLDEVWPPLPLEPLLEPSPEPEFLEHSAFLVPSITADFTRDRIPRMGTALPDSSRSADLPLAADGGRGGGDQRDAGGRTGSGTLQSRRRHGALCFGGRDCIGECFFAAPLFPLSLPRRLLDGDCEIDLHLILVNL